jgi:hypothetical protein
MRIGCCRLSASLSPSAPFLGLMLFFWLRITLSVLQLSRGQVIGISFVALVAFGLVAGFVALVASSAGLYGFNSSNDAAG